MYCTLEEWLSRGAEPSTLGELIPYEDFRTGLSFDQVRQILAAEARRKYEAGQYMFVSRSTVLGRWNELKRAMYQEYVNAYESGRELEDFTPAAELELPPSSASREYDWELPF